MLNFLKLKDAHLHALPRRNVYTEFTVHNESPQNVL